MAMIQCKECSKQISDSAKVCPHCGKRLKMGVLLKLVIGVVGLGCAILLYGLTISENEARAMAQRELCMDKFVPAGMSTVYDCQKLYHSIIDAGKSPTPKPEVPHVMGRWELEAIEEAKKKAAQEADPVYQREQLAIAEQARSECIPIVDQQKETYKKLFAKGRYWDASVSIRRCANALNDPALKLLLADAEIRSYTADIKSSKTTPEEKHRALDSLQRDYPEEAQKFDKVAPAKK